PDEAAGTAIAMTNMLVMIGAIFLQPLIGHLLDWSHQHHLHLMHANIELIHQGSWELYSALDYRLALSILPIGILTSAFLTLFLKETYAHTN
ncbi:MAG: MFS transporter, partial [Legionella sp. 21-45-4]